MKSMPYIIKTCIIIVNHIEKKKLQSDFSNRRVISTIIAISFETDTEYFNRRAYNNLYSHLWNVNKIIIPSS